MIFKGLGINIDGYESKRAHELWKIMKREYGANNIIALRVYTDGGYSYIVGFKNGNMKSTERDKIISRVPDIYYKIILIPNKKWNNFTCNNITEVYNMYTETLENHKITFAIEQYIPSSKTWDVKINTTSNAFI